MPREDHRRSAERLPALLAGGNPGPRLRRFLALRGGQRMGQGIPPGGGAGAPARGGIEKTIPPKRGVGRAEPSWYITSPLPSLGGIEKTIPP